MIQWCVLAGMASRKLKHAEKRRKEMASFMYKGRLSGEKVYHQLFC